MAEELEPTTAEEREKRAKACVCWMCNRLIADIADVERREAEYRALEARAASTLEAQAEETAKALRDLITAEAKGEKLEAKMDEARKLLEGLEWAGEQAGEFVCPECYAPCPQRTAAEKRLMPPCEHEADCALAAFLNPPEIAGIE